MKIIIIVFPLLLLTGCTDSKAQEQQGNIKTPWDKWYFSFTTPKALPAQVTLVKLLDIDGYGYVFQTIDQPQGNSVGSWGARVGIGITTFNKGDAPPQVLTFCWDSIVDKKVYETTLLFSSDTPGKMTSSEPQWNNPEEAYYFRHMVIGLAPEGKVRVWLKNNGKPNIELTSTKITTVSGKDLDMCKGVTKSDFSYGYDDDIKEFIKGKRYPYGNW